MTPILSLHVWTSLPSDVRHRIRTHFSIPRSSHVMVVDGRLESDGTTMEDFKHLTVEKMQHFLETKETDFYKLFNIVVEKVKDELYPKPVEAVAPVVEEVKETTHEKKNAKKSK